MRIADALGGNALLQRSDPMTIEGQRHDVRIAPGASATIGSVVTMPGIVAEARMRVT